MHVRACDSASLLRRWPSRRFADQQRAQLEARGGSVKAQDNVAVRAAAGCAVGATMGRSKGGVVDHDVVSDPLRGDWREVLYGGARGGLDRVHVSVAVQVRFAAA